MKKKYIIVSILFTLASVLFTIAVKTIDVKAIGPNGSKVGLASINEWFKSLKNPNMDIYKLTEVFGLLVFVIVGFYGVIGLVQLIKRKSIFKVDREIISLGILYVLMFTVYVVFEKVVINYRPILMDGELEASFPSSHTVLAICTCVSSLLVSSKYINKKFINVTTFFTVLLLTVVFIGRTISGVHWLSDIMGGCLISITLLSYFKCMIKRG